MNLLEVGGVKKKRTKRKRRKRKVSTVSAKFRSTLKRRVQGGHYNIKVHHPTGW
jgi:hypothetical protein